MFIRLWTDIVSASNYVKCMSLSNQKCMSQPALINLNTNECSQWSHYYPFTIKLDRCVGSFNFFNDLSNKACAPNKIEYLNMYVFNVITKKNEQKNLTKDNSIDGECLKSLFSLSKWKSLQTMQSSYNIRSVLEPLLACFRQSLSFFQWGVKCLNVRKFRL